MNKEKTIKEYQCSGCVLGEYPECYEQDHSGIGCKAHCAGTIASGIGRLFLGLPTGFNRVGFNEKTKIWIFDSYSDLEEKWVYDKFNVPVWKYVNEHKHTLVRVFLPRINHSEIHIILEDCKDKINCLEIDQADIEEMD